MALWRIVVKNSGNAACKDKYYCPLNMFLCRILGFWRKTSPLLRGNNGCPLKFRLSLDINLTVDGYICYFEAYSVPLQQPKDYLCVQYIGCPRK